MAKNAETQGQPCGAMGKCQHLIRAPFHVPAASLVIHPPANGLGKTVGDGASV